MSDLSKAIAMSGALDEGMLREFNKWKLPGVVVPEDDGFKTPEEAIDAIEEAMTSANQVEVRVTDLDILKHYLLTRKDGKLHLVTENGTKGTWPVVFGVITKLGQIQYIIPWNSDTIEGMMTNGESYLLDGKRKIYFGDVTDLYFGEQKAFMLCTPIREGNGNRSTNHQS